MFLKFQSINGNITKNNLYLKVGSCRANQFGYKKRKSLQKRELILDRVGYSEKIYEKQFIIFVIGYVIDNYECTSRKFLIDPSKQYLRNRKNRNEKHVSMRGTRQAVHKKFGYSSLLVLNRQIKKYQTKYLIAYWYNGIVNLLTFD